MVLLNCCEANETKGCFKQVPSLSNLHRCMLLQIESLHFLCLPLINMGVLFRVDNNWFVLQHPFRLFKPFCNFFWCYFHLLKVRLNIIEIFWETFQMTILVIEAIFTIFIKSSIAHFYVPRTILSVRKVNAEKKK